MDRRHAPSRSPARLFATYAAISLVPVIVLGLVLVVSYRHEARDRGLREGRSEAMAVAHTAIEPLLDATPLAAGMSASETAAMTRLTQQAIAKHDVLELRLRTLGGHVAYADHAADLKLPPDDESLDAASGHAVVRLTHLQSDRTDGPTGPAAVEVYLPVTGGWPAARVGVLEVYLPYAPIREDVGSGLDMLYRTLAGGLALLWASLFLISLSVTRRLRQQVAANRFDAEHDALTSLPNRAVFRARIERQLASGAPTVAIIDLDRFKQINDTLGHQSGDQVLREIAARLEAGVGSNDVVARLGGDEFGILLGDEIDPASTLARLRSEIAEELVIDSLPLSIEASIGYVRAPDDGADAATLVQRADVAMYQAKETHAGLARYDAAKDHYDAVDLALLGDLRAAIASDQLVLYHQPKLPLDGGPVTTVEVLVRWQHPTLGLLPPGAFLPLAEQTELMQDLTRWVLHRALLDVRDIGDLGVAVNVSARDLGQRDFASTVLRALADAHVPSTRLTIEITETAILADPARAAGVLGDLAAAGVRVSIDDFGQGQTSLSYLSELPVHELKIDRQFVSDMVPNRSHRAIVRSIVDLGHNLGMRVVAEGVESDDVLSALGAVGCDIAQGFHIAVPMPASELREWLRAPAVAGR